MQNADPLSRYFAGEALYGDDFSGERLAEWYAGEREGYAGHVVTRNEEYRYKYHALNRHYGYSALPAGRKLRVLGLGSAYGDELRPIAPFASSFDIIEPSDEFSSEREIDGVRARYHKPREDGIFDLPDAAFDVITVFGVFHHIANVSTVIRECYRVLKPGGLLLTREPIVSMGDWRAPRNGLTRNERGIPHKLFHGMIVDAGFQVKRTSLFDFAPFVRVVDNMGIDCFGNRWTLFVDRVLSAMFAFNKRYHRPKFLQKFGPASMFVVAQKPAA